MSATLSPDNRLSVGQPYFLRPTNNGAVGSWVPLTAHHSSQARTGQQGSFGAPARQIALCALMWLASPVWLVFETLIRRTSPSGRSETSRRSNATVTTAGA